ncbi:MAG: hypothetical protein ACQEP8_00485 [Chlamydiota bacterium]
MAMADLGTKVKEISKLDPSQTNSIQDLMDKRLAARMAPGHSEFDRLVQQVENHQDATKVAADTKLDKQQSISHPSPMEAAEQLNKTHFGGRREDLSANKVIAQSEDASRQITQLQQQLADPNLKVRGSAQRLLRSKLNNINNNLQTSLTKVGAEQAVGTPTGNELASGVKNFIGKLGYSQSSLSALNKRMSMMSDSGQALSPATMLTVQIKMHTVVQEIEFFSSLLGKSIESVKTVMNVQV